MPSWLSVLLGSLVTVAPSVIPGLGQPYAAIATGILAAANAAYHLFQTAPGQK